MLYCVPLQGSSPCQTVWTARPASTATRLVTTPSPATVTQATTAHWLPWRATLPVS